MTSLLSSLSGWSGVSSCRDHYHRPQVRAKVSDGDIRVLGGAVGCRRKWGPKAGHCPQPAYVLTGQQVSDIPRAILWTQKFSRA